MYQSFGWVYLISDEMLRPAPCKSQTVMVLSHALLQCTVALCPLLLEPLTWRQCLIRCTKPATYADAHASCLHGPLRGTALPPNVGQVFLYLSCLITWQTRKVYCRMSVRLQLVSCDILVCCKFFYRSTTQLHMALIRHCSTSSHN